ncbi:hypothetical protein CEXT_678091 [Caerostris extrusa]|uniref:Uncharacterized protein n=1 Tax=Caerostris extrusa TaxID=172846 RepID=A0AAV4TGI2_CAEEX|nr:hypothetical protein CEXT_678091 [Caerostris extrusa]
MQIPSHPRKLELITHLLPKTHKKFDADHCSSHHVRPGSRQSKSNDRAHAALVPPTKTNEDSAAISLCYLAGRHPTDPTPTH